MKTVFFCMFFCTINKLCIFALLNVTCVTSVGGARCMVWRHTATMHAYE